MENKKLTKEDKLSLFKTLSFTRAFKIEELYLEKEIEKFCKKKIYKYLENVFIDHPKLLTSYKKVREEFRKQTYSCNEYIKDINPNLCGYPSINGYAPHERNLIKPLNPDDHIGDLGEKDRYIRLDLVPNLNIKLGWPEDCPDLNILMVIADNYGFKEKLVALDQDFKSILNEDELNEFLNLVSEYVHTIFLKNNYLREYRCPKTTSIYTYGEFLWWINTWEELKNINEEWYNILQKEVSEEKLINKNTEFEISGKSTKEILGELDKELGL